MKYHITTTKRFDKAFLKCVSRGLDISKLRNAMSLLENEGKLPDTYHPHKLKGYKGKNVWECHIEPDWLLVWEQRDDKFLLIMVSTAHILIYLVKTDGKKIHKIHESRDFVNLP